MFNFASMLIPWTHLRNRLKTLKLRHEQAPNTGRANSKLEQPFRFTDLPFDIRLMIYEICLTAPSIITIHASVLHEGLNKRLGRTAVELGGGRTFRLTGYTEPFEFEGYCNVQILSTCKLVYEEAIPIVYSRNCFHFSQGHMSNPCNALVEFTNRLDLATLTQLRRLTLSFPPLLGPRMCPLEDEFLLSLDAIRKFGRLESLHVYSISAYWASDLDTLRMIDQSRGNAKVLLTVYTNELPYPITSMHGEASKIIAEVEDWGWQFVIV